MHKALRARLELYLIDGMLALDAETRREISLLSHYQRTYGTVTEGDQRSRAHLAFARAGYSQSPTCFRSRIKPNGNILLDAEGHVIHIDFGFVQHSTWWGVFDGGGTVQADFGLRGAAERRGSITTLRARMLASICGVLSPLLPRLPHAAGAYCLHGLRPTTCARPLYFPVVVT